jgi:hypothetical protein
MAKKENLTLRLDPFFLHARLVRETLPAGLREQSDREIEHQLRKGLYSREFIVEAVLGRALARALPILNPGELGRAHLNDTLEDGRLVGIQQAFYFRRRRGSSNGEYIAFHAKLNTDNSVTITGLLNAEHCVGTSGRDHLSGRASVYILGIISEVTPKSVGLRPIFAGRRFYAHNDDLLEIPDSRRVYASSVDQFARLRDMGPMRKSDLNLLKQIPEKQVKEWFAEIIGEPFVPNDWGGETSDLSTNQLSIDGEPCSAAFLLKGPSFFKPMTIAALGKNGDQINRLFGEPVDLFVLQHCHHVRSAVVRLMGVFAWDARKPSRYMVIDGATTFQILRAYARI